MRGCDQDGGSSGHPEDEVGEGWKQKREEATAVLLNVMKKRMRMVRN